MTRNSFSASAASGCVSKALAEKQPVISVDTKKKELVGDFKNNGRELRPKGIAGSGPRNARLRHPGDWAGRAPYGVYDLAANAGWGERRDEVPDTAEFAVGTIRLKLVV